VKVLVLGASGFVGRHLSSALRSRNDSVLTASLRDPAAAAVTAASCDAVVNLAGEPIAQRWDSNVKQRIASSRVDAPKRFFEALGAHSERSTKTYVSASAVGYYGTSETATFDENSPPGNDFLAGVCKTWESIAGIARGLGMREAVVRTGIALGKDGGALPTMLPPFRMGLGGVIGNGKQWYSWVHIDDVVGIYLAAIDRGDGPYNATAPNPATNADFTKALGAVLSRPVVMPTPKFALHLLLGEGASVVIEGQRALPKRTTGELGYAFNIRSSTML
jgi:uncharacterized protein (TIGR01777 family)